MNWEAGAVSAGTCLFLKFLSDSDEQPGGNHHPVRPTDSWGCLCTTASETTSVWHAGYQEKAESACPAHQVRDPEVFSSILAHDFSVK